MQEPRRLWRRYLLGGPQFLYYLAIDSLLREGEGPTREPLVSRNEIPSSAILSHGKGK